MAWTITENGNRLDVAIDGRFVAAVAPAARDEIISKMRDGMNVLFDLGSEFPLHLIDDVGYGRSIVDQADDMEDAPGNQVARNEDIGQGRIHPYLFGRRQVAFLEYIVEPQQLPCGGPSRFQRKTAERTEQILNHISARMEWTALTKSPTLTRSFASAGM